MLIPLTHQDMRRLGCYQGQRGKLGKVSGVLEGLSCRTREACLPGGGRPVGSANGVAHQVPWQREEDGKGAGQCWFWFRPNNKVQRDQLRP